MPVKVFAASVRAMVADVAGKVIVVESVPSSVRVLRAVKVLPVVIARVPAGTATVPVVSGNVMVLVLVGVPVSFRYVVAYVPDPNRYRSRNGVAVAPRSTPVCASSAVLIETDARFDRARFAPLSEVPHEKAFVAAV